MAAERNRGFAAVAGVCRILLGAVFVFSGLAKSVDPWGTALKIEEYFAAFGVGGLAPAAPVLAVGQCALELALGLMLLFGTARRLASCIALLLMGCFTLLTLVIAVWNPVDDCGCFGDALRLSNWMTFAKNAVLLPVAAVVWRDAKARGGFAFTRRDTVWSAAFLLLALALNLFSWFCLPPVDTSAYRVGTDLRRDVLCTSCMNRSVVLVYEDVHTGELHEFSLSDTTWYDTARWRYVDTRTGYDDLPAEAQEYDFALWRDGRDVADEVVFAQGATCLVLVRDAGELSARCRRSIAELAAAADATGMRVVYVAGTDGGDAPEPFVVGGRSVPAYGMDRRLMARLLRADAGALRIEDGVITAKRPCRTMAEIAE